MEEQMIDFHEKEFLHNDIKITNHPEK